MESIVKTDSDVAAETEVKAESQEGQAYVSHEIHYKFLYDLMLVPQYIINLEAEWISIETGMLKVSLPEADHQEAKAVEKVIKLLNEELLKHDIKKFVAVLHETSLSQEVCCRVKNTHIHVIVECTKYDTGLGMQKNKKLSSRKFTTLLAQSDGTLGEKMSQLNWMLKTCYLNFPDKTLGLLKQTNCKPLGIVGMQKYFESISLLQGLIKKFRLPKGSHLDADSDDVERLKEKIVSLEKEVALLKFDLSVKEAQITDLEYKKKTLEKDNYKNMDHEMEDNQQEQSAEIQQARKSLGDRDLKIEHSKEEE